MSIYTLIVALVSWSGQPISTSVVERITYDECMQLKRQHRAEFIINQHPGRMYAECVNTRGIV